MITRVLRHRRALGATLAAVSGVALAAGFTAARGANDVRAAVSGDTVAAYNPNRSIGTANVLGGMYYTTAKEGCSTGFVMHSGTQQFISTAGHCGAKNVAVFVPGFDPSSGLPQTGATQVGAITANGLPDPAHPEQAGVDDTALITVGSASAIVGPDIIDNISPAGGIGTKSVVGTVAQNNVYVGETFCLSGGRTGLHCGLRVVSPSVSTALPDGYQTQGMIGLQAPSGTIGACPGDSGSPVYAIVPGTNGILAVGTVTAVDSSEIDDTNSTPGADCTLKPNASTEDIYVTPIAQYTARLGVDLDLPPVGSFPGSN